MAAVAGNRRRVWAALGTPSTVRVVTFLMLVYAVVIGALVFGYARVQSCLADYSNDAAVSTSARARAAADDRRLNDAEAAIADSDRVRYRANSKALSDLLVTLAQPAADKTDREAAFANLLRVDAESSRVLDASEVKRQQIRRERAQIEAERAKNPPPPPPSEIC